MTVIIPHPDDELRLIKIQNELMQKLYKSTNLIFFKHFPLWIPLKIEDNDYCSKIKMKGIGRFIKKISMGKLRYENNRIIMEVTILAEKENIFSDKLVMLDGSKNNKIIGENQIKQLEESLNDVFRNNIIGEKSLKIFRIGAVHQLSDNAAAISDSVWCKLK